MMTILAPYPHRLYPLAIWLAAKKIRLLATDVDGVLTPSTIIWDANRVEQKVFNVKDGLGLRRIRKLGVQTAIITGRQSDIVELRGAELDFDFIYQAVPDKSVVLDELLAKTGLTLEQVAYMGDDLPDLPVLKRVGLAICPADAPIEVQRHCHWVSPFVGGDGCMRAVIDMISLAKKSV
jgi:3-deoxy-D-manno-octulosonate 8-phosphate phosphatase (KDO 8-P phosphatase)